MNSSVNKKTNGLPWLLYGALFIYILQGSGYYWMFGLQEDEDIIDGAQYILTDR